VDDRPVPQGAYFAHRCPEAIQLDILRPCPQLGRSPFVEGLVEDGRSFEQRIFDRLASEVDGAARIDPAASRPQRETATSEAMKKGAALIIGGRLPTDRTARRAGEPDLLVKLSDAGAGPSPRYAPVEVKLHNSEAAASGAEPDPLMCSELSEPWPDRALPRAGRVARGRRRDLLQLAHYQRMLEACGHGAGAGALGGIIGREERVVWHDLQGAAVLCPSGYLEEASSARRSVLEVYDDEFAYRLAVFDRTNEHLSDGGVALLAEPILVSDCESCEWREWCAERLEEAGDPSLLAGVTLAKRRAHRARGNADIASVASLDLPTARLVSAGVELADLGESAGGHPAETLLKTVIPMSARQLNVLGGEGFETVGDLSRICRHTAAYEGAGMNDLPRQIEMARARTGSAPVYRLSSVEQILVPRADVEVDIDMENVAGGCYLWGALVTDRRPGGRSAYNSFASFESDISTGEIVAFKAFWAWLTELRGSVRSGGHSFAGFCYYKSAENGQMRRIAARCNLEDEVDQWLGSSEWVDMWEVVKSQLVTGRSLGLKNVAPLAGHSWRGSEVGGTIAMLRYSAAVADPDPAVRAEAREWLLSYNEDDVRATWALREWLDHAGAELPSVEPAQSACASA
jgi:predicted RecB family nuclease